MKRILHALCVICIVAFCVGGPVARGQPKGGAPGLVWVFFDDPGMRRPAESGVDANVNLDTGTQINDYGRIWLGWIVAPVAGEVVFSAEADDGMRLWLGDELVVDAYQGGALEGRFEFAAKGESVPLLVDFFQSGGAAHARLYWRLAGRERELVPPSALWHSNRDKLICRQLREGTLTKEDLFAMAPSETKAEIYSPGKCRAKEAPVRLSPGPHLFIDDFLVDSAENLDRVVNCPRRDPAIPNPIVTGKEDGCFQPYMTILREPATGRFRIWYGCRVEDRNPGLSHIGYMESDDGIHWQRPHRVLKDPAPIQFGVSVVDDGPDFPDRDRRFKYAWWHGGGLRIASSPDGLEWTPIAPGVILPHSHDINSIRIDTARKRYVATVSVYETGPTWSGKRRVTMQSASKDLLTWETLHYIITPQDGIDEGETQFYAMEGYLERGGLVVGMVKVLRDDLKADDPPDPPNQYGLGYTTLAWTRDGETWFRDRTPFFDRNPEKGTWDHAHAWIDEQVLVGDDVFLYYGGYARGHKVNRFEERQIGLVRIKRDRYAGYAAGDDAGSLVTPEVVIAGERMTLNVDAAGGEVRVEILAVGGPIAKSRPISADALSAPVQWDKALGTLKGKTVRLKFTLKRARLYAFDIE